MSVDILKNKPLNRPVNMNIETSLLYPVSNTQHSTRFIFDRKGVLNSNSRLQLRAFKENDSFANVTDAIVGMDLYHGASDLSVAADAVSAVVGALSLTLANINPVPADGELVGKYFVTKHGNGAGEVRRITVNTGLDITLESAMTRLANGDRYCIYEPNIIKLHGQHGTSDDQGLEGWSFEVSAGGAGLHNLFKNATPYPTVSSYNHADHKIAFDNSVTPTDAELETSVAGAGAGDALERMGRGITLKFTRSADNIHFAPISTGVSSLILDAVLTIGGRRISTLEDVPHYHTFKNLHLTNEYRDGILSVQEGTSDEFLGSDSGGVGLDRSVIGLTVESQSEVKRIQPESEDGAKLSIALSSIIPMMRGLRLPLFLIDQEVALEVYWRPSGLGKTFCSYNDGSNVYNLTRPPTTIDNQSVIIMADYMFFPEEMEQIQNQVNSGNGVSIPYDELILINHTEEASPAGSDKVYNKPIALGGKLVKSLMISTQDPTTSGLLGDYHSYAFQKGSKYNFVIDSVSPYYVNDVKNSSVQYNEVGKVLGTPLNISQAQYSWNNTVDNTFTNTDAVSYITPSVFMNHKQNEAIAGRQHYVGVDFTLQAGKGAVNGKRMSNLPTNFKHTVNKTAGVNNEPAKNYPVRVYANIQKVMNINRGLIEMVDV